MAIDSNNNNPLQIVDFVRFVCEPRSIVNEYNFVLRNLKINFGVAFVVAVLYWFRYTLECCKWTISRVALIIESVYNILV